MTKSPRQVIIHCKESLKQWLFKSELQFEYNCGEYDVIVDNIDSLNDDELCHHYGIDYDQVNCIELVPINSML